MNDKIHKISVQRLLLDNVLQELKRNNQMRELAKPNEIIWQQMTMSYFETFLDHGLHFVRYDTLCDHNPGQERDWQKSYPSLNDYSKNNYISCWYNSSQLSNVIFEAYAKKGIAIGIEIEKLIKLLPNDSDDFYLGNVQYISDEELDTNEYVVADYQKIAPVFLKKAHCSADKEFRICMYKENDTNKESKVKCEFGDGWYIAMTHTITEDPKALLEKKGLKYIESEIKMDGFIVYKIKRNNNSKS